MFLLPRATGTPDTAARLTSDVRHPPSALALEHDWHQPRHHTRPPDFPRKKVGCSRQGSSQLSPLAGDIFPAASDPGVQVVLVATCDRRRRDATRRDANRNCAASRVDRIGVTCARRGSGLLMSRSPTFLGVALLLADPPKYQGPRHRSFFFRSSNDTRHVGLHICAVREKKRKKSQAPLRRR
jgi:hypothetical protein